MFLTEVSSASLSTWSTERPSSSGRRPTGEVVGLGVALGVVRWGDDATGPSEGRGPLPAPLLGQSSLPERKKFGFMRDVVYI